LVGLNRIAWWRSPWRARAGQAVGWGAIALGTLGLVVAPILVPHPSGVEQFFLNGQHNVGKDARFFVLTGMIQDLLGIGADSSHRLLKLFVKAGLLAGLLSGVASLASNKGRCWLEFWLGPLVGFCLLLTMLAHNPMYYRMLTPFYVAGALVALAHLAPLCPKATVLLAAVLTFSWLASGYIFWRDAFALLTLPADQQPAFQARYLPRVVPKGSTVFGHGCWWFLADSCHVVDAWWAHPDMSTIDYAVLETGEVFKGHNREWMPQPISWSRNQGLEKATSSALGKQIDQSVDRARADARASQYGNTPVNDRPLLTARDHGGDGCWCAEYRIHGGLKEPELSYICRSFRVIEDRTNHDAPTLFGRPLFRRQKGFGCLVLKRQE
jgi:hypothetical protein